MESPLRIAEPGARSESSVEARVKQRALELFDAVGIAAVGPLEAKARYEAWIAAGRHGEMAWLASDKHRRRRADPAEILRGAATVVAVALFYPPGSDAARDERLGRIARYAAGEDYHRLMNEKIKAFQRAVAELLPRARVLGYSDTGAILERAWAERAGIGWVGKHSGMISPRLGSWFLLAEFLIDRPLDSDPASATDRCGTCTRCIDACPTGAIVGERQVDARLCISYLTIELRGPIPIELRPKIGDWIFGCDVCQEVCPWNRFAPPAREARLHARSLEGWTLERFLELGESGFDELFAGSPIRRTRRAGFLRNVCVALGNRGAPASAAPLMRALERDPDALVRGHAAWALGEIARRMTDREGEPFETIVASLRAAEPDGDGMVRDEARRALERAERRATAEG
jgi:epoxyqueuosine reductase